MAGAPRRYKTAEELQKAIDTFFENETHLTITGLALAIGFASRQSIYDYEKSGEFSYVIKKARLKVENWYEKNLSEKNATGAIFALKNMGWSDRIETKNETTTEVKGSIDISKWIDED